MITLNFNEFRKQDFYFNQFAKIAETRGAVGKIELASSDIGVSGIASARMYLSKYQVKNKIRYKSKVSNGELFAAFD